MIPPNSDSGLMNYALRMVIPIKREFGRSLDVQHFLHDLEYAKEVIDEAMHSQNPKLRDYAAYLGTRILGPRHASGLSPAVAQRIDETSVVRGDPSTDQPLHPDSSVEDDARRVILDKYRSGLR